MKKAVKILESLFWESRLFIILAVIASIISSIFLILLATYDIFSMIVDIFSKIGNNANISELQKKIIARIIHSIDLYLIATVLLIFGIGLYELFVSKIVQIEEDKKSAGILIIHSLDQLKEKLAKVIIMVLIVAYFKNALDMKYEDILQLLYLGTGIFLISLSLYLMHKNH
ncbi:YqhA family protein [Thermodesulfovibrio hydrogeniphilus]